MVPAGRVPGRAGKAVAAFDRRNRRSIELTQRGDDRGNGVGLAGTRFDVPLGAAFVPRGRDCFIAKANVRAELEIVGEVLCVFLNFLVAREEMAPAQAWRE